MKMSWGIRIMIIYTGFVALIVTLVVASMHQHFDLVSASYYADEVAYQKVIDAGKNQSKLSSPIDVHADAATVTISLPFELKDKVISGEVQFYSPVNSAWDERFKILVANNSMVIPRNKLRNTRYTVKIDLHAGGNAYYQESEIKLHS